MSPLGNYFEEEGRLEDHLMKSIVLFGLRVLNLFAVCLEG